MSGNGERRRKVRLYGEQQAGRTRPRGHGFRPAGLQHRQPGGDGSERSGLQPVVQVEPEAAAALMRLAEAQPAAEVLLDLEARRMTAGGAIPSAVPAAWPVTLPEVRRQAFLTVSWDTVGMLLAGGERIRAAAGRLPYLARFPYPAS